MQNNININTKMIYLSGSFNTFCKFCIYGRMLERGGFHCPMLYNVAFEGIIPSQLNVITSVVFPCSLGSAQHADR